MHVASFADRWGLGRLSDRIRHTVSIPRVESVIGRLLRTDFRFVVTEIGGCAIDIDKEPEYDAVRARFSEWREEQQARAAEILGRSLSESAGDGSS
jgi:hypothetical protein